MPITEEGRGRTQNISPEQHNAVRRAKKAHQKKGRGRPQSQHTDDGSLFEQIAVERVRRQTELAREIVDGRLVPESPAWQVARAVIDAFPTAKRRGEQSMTDVAIDTAKQHLPKELSPGAIRLGITTATQLLRAAGNIVYAS